MGLAGEEPVRLAGPPEITGELVLPALAGLVAGGLRLETTFGRPAETLLAGLAAGRFDVVVSTIDPGDAVRADPLFVEEFCLVGAPRAVRAAGGFAGLDRLPLIAFAPDLPVIRTFWPAAFGTDPGRPAVVAPDFRAVLAMVVAGAGVSVLPHYLCRSHIADGKLVEPVGLGKTPANQIYLATKMAGGPAVKAVRDRLLSAVPAAA